MKRDRLDLPVSVVSGNQIFARGNAAAEKRKAVIDYSR